MEYVTILPYNLSRELRNRADLQIRFTIRTDQDVYEKYERGALLGALRVGKPPDACLRR